MTYCTFFSSMLSLSDFNCLNIIRKNNNSVISLKIRIWDRIDSFSMTIFLGSVYRSSVDKKAKKLREISINLQRI